MPQTTQLDSALMAPAAALGNAPGVGGAPAHGSPKTDITQPQNRQPRATEPQFRLYLPKHGVSMEGVPIKGTRGAGPLPDGISWWHTVWVLKGLLDLFFFSRQK